jgi:uncharacterized protein YndB with AHSA1/START domain
MIRSVLHIDAPRETVFAVLTDYSRYREWFPGCEHSAVVAHRDGIVEAEFILNMSKKVKVGMRFEAQPATILRFHMISGKDLKSYSGSYRLSDSANGRGTVVVAEMRIELAIMIPTFVVDYFAKQSMDHTGNSLRRYLNRLSIPLGVSSV